MLNIARDSFNLKDFEARLQQHLKEVFGESICITVSCVLNDNHLMILTQAEKLPSLSPAKVFSEIQTIVAQESVPQSLHIQMNFRVHDNQSVEQVLELGTSAYSLQSDLQKDFLSLPPVATHLKQQVLSQLKFYLSNPSSKRIAGIGIGIILLLGGIYIVSRPCTMGSCQVIPQAQQLATEALALIETSPSNQNFSFAQQRLNQAIEQLIKIPWWSSYHSQANSLLTLYQARLDSLELIIMARKKATQAVILAQASPLPASQWNEVKQLWLRAIADLNQLPPESPFFSFAEAKIREYQRNLATVKQRLQAEKQAQISLAEAQEAAKLAKVRQNAAQSLQDWQLVYATWQTAIKRLKEIAPGTTITQQGKQLLDSYIPQFTKASVRFQQEKLAQKHYNQAIEQAQLALKSQQSKQWSQAVSYWRKAITSLKQIQPNTFTASQAQPLMSNYMLDLNQADINLKKALNLQQVRQNIEEVCTKTQKICSYKISDNAIKINLTSTYMQQVWQTALQAKAQSNIQIQLELLNHISRLEQTWQTISNKAQKPVEIYNPQGELMVSYNSKKG